MIRRALFCYLAILLIATAALPLLAQTAQSYSADITFSSTDRHTAGRIYSSGDKERIEISKMKRPSPPYDWVPIYPHVTITDNTKKKAWSFIPRLKQYWDTTESHSFGSHNPANPCEGGAETTCQRVDTETVNGQVCDKWEFVSKGKGLNVTTWTTWISKTNGIPIKWVTADGRTTELSNIQIGPQKEKLFKVPASYDKAGEPRRPNPSVTEFESIDYENCRLRWMFGCVA